MRGRLGATGRQFRGGKVESQSIRTGGQVDEGLEMRGIHRPGYGGKAFAVVVYRDTSVQRM